MNEVWIEMAAWKILGSVGLLFVISEVFVPGFVLFPVGIACLITGVVALWVDAWIVLLPVLAVVEVATFFFFRNVLKKYHGKTRAYTNAEGMIGQEAEVIEAIRINASGYVKLYGDEWQAKASGAQEIPRGARVLISKVDGNKVWVEPISGKEELC